MYNSTVTQYILYTTFNFNKKKQQQEKERMLSFALGNLIKAPNILGVLHHYFFSSKERLRRYISIYLVRNRLIETLNCIDSKIV